MGFVVLIVFKSDLSFKEPGLVLYKIVAFSYFYEFCAVITFVTEKFVLYV